MNKTLLTISLIILSTSYIHASYKETNDIKKTENVVQEEPIEYEGEVLGVSTKDVKAIYEGGCWIKYNITTEKYSTDCNIQGIKMESVKLNKNSSFSNLYVTGSLPKDFHANLKLVKCWINIGKCKEVTLYEGISSFKVLTEVDWYINGQEITPSKYSYKNDSISMYFSSTKDLSGKTLGTRSKVQIFFQKDSKWYFLTKYVNGTEKIPEIQSSTPKGPFRFPFNRIIGVTQWHGCTAYQCPHGGIDFGSVNEPLYSIGSGSVVSKGYDKYGGDCFAGGNYVILKHSNGMYSTYFHLSKILVEKNNSVSSGTLIGYTGNSGAWNCQPLKSHLHFELRSSRDSSSHVNPVPYINIDWNKIPTLGWQSNPGRLTGDNPHPGS